MEQIWTLKDYTVLPMTRVMYELFETNEVLEANFIEIWNQSKQAGPVPDDLYNGFLWTEMGSKATIRYVI